MENAVIKSFPLSSPSVELSPEDFIRFSRSYIEILIKRIPTVQSVVFVHNIANLSKLYGASEDKEELENILADVLSGERAYVIHDQCLMLPFPVADGGRVVAILDQPDEHFRQKVSDDWLSDVISAVTHEYQLLRQVRVDSLTGLLNVSNLFYLLDTYSLTTNLHLVLVEVPAQRPSFENILRQSKNCSTLLRHFIQGDVALHHLGQSTFALVLQNDHGNGRKEVEGALVAHLKKAGCHRVHIGSSFNESRVHSVEGRLLLDQAWTALHHAAKKGPFSFCNYNSLAYPEKGQLSAPDKKIARKLARLWAESMRFSLVHFKSDKEYDSVRSLVEPKLPPETMIVEYDNDVLVYLNGFDKNSAFDWVKETIQYAADSSSGKVTVSAGVSSYPYGDFKKTEILFNCQKALLHAAFFGNSSGVVFDAVSLNISGDIYFSDGDLAKAVMEYKRGIKCDPKDVNLHNSLGVALVMMNKLPMAMRCFEQALKFDSKNFMALYNLGLGEQARNENVKAYSYMEKALENYANDEGGQEILSDLKVQLGILSCDIGKFKQSVFHLLPWFEENKKNQGAERIHYYLGKAYYGLKENKKAMAWLQRALRFNEYDDRAMNLLGTLYLEEKQGDDIALSLCRKSVELEPSNMPYRLDIAKAQRKCGQFVEARDNLRRCLRRKELKNEAQREMARGYQEEGYHQKAKVWYRKVLAQQNLKKVYLEEAKKAVNAVS